MTFERGLAVFSIITICVVFTVMVLFLAQPEERRVPVVIQPCTSDCVTVRPTPLTTPQALPPT